MAKKVNEEVIARYAADRAEVDVVFPGHFLNYGYWDQDNMVSRACISVEDRVESQKQLYRKALDTLEVRDVDRLLEVGCGRGAGTVLALDEYLPTEVCGIDAVPRQLDRAMVANKEALTRYRDRLSFKQGVAADIPYPDGHFDKVISVEAIQHFPDIFYFCSEIARVTGQDSRIAITSVFAPGSEVTTNDWASRIESFDGVCYAHPIDELKTALIKNGFSTVNVESIGDRVFRGMDSWFEEISFESSERNCLVAYEEGIIDYYLVSAC